jgi:hypothetical protein
MPSGNRATRPDRRPATSRVTQRLGWNPSPNTDAHNLANRRAAGFPRPPAYMARNLRSEMIRVLIVSSVVLVSSAVGPLGPQSAARADKLAASIRNIGLET